MADPNPPALNPEYHTKYPQQQPQQQQPQQYPPPDQSQYPPQQQQQPQQYAQQPQQQYPPQNQSQYPPPPQQQQQQQQQQPQQQNLYPQVTPQPYANPNPTPPTPEMAVIVCYACQHENFVPITVLSLACARCGAPNEKPKPPPPQENPFTTPTPTPPAFIPSDPPMGETIKEEIKEKTKKELNYLSDFRIEKQTKFEIADLGPPFFFASMREWKWKITSKGAVQFEIDLKYDPRHCQEDLTLLRNGRTLATATFSFGKYKIESTKGDAIAQLTINKGMLGGGDGELVLTKECGPMKPGPIRVHIARMGTHKFYQRESMVVRWGTEHSTLTIEVEENTDVALMLFAVCCFERWG